MITEGNMKSRLSRFRTPIGIFVIILVAPWCMSARSRGSSSAIRGANRDHGAEGVRHATASC